MSATAYRAFEVRHLQLGRALFAAIAALMITFSADHSAPVGVSVFSGYAVASGLVLLLAAWLVFTAQHRAPAIVQGIIMMVAGMVGGIPPMRTTTGFFVLVISWAVVSGLAEFIAGILARRRSRTDTDARDAIAVGIFSLALAGGLLLVNPSYSSDFYLEEAGRTLTLTGITIGVGLFGAYAAIVAVYLGIAAFTPRRAEPAPAEVQSESVGEPA